MSGPAMWVVERSGSRVFLFGETVGVRRDDVWLTEPIRAAFDDSREFWCEVADAQEIAESPLVVEHGLSTEPLSSRLNDQQLRRLHETAGAVELDPLTLEGLRPWLAGQLLEHAHRSHARIEAEVGVHEVFLGLANAAGKSIRTELPDAAATLSFFGDLDELVEIDYLMWTIDRIASGDAELDRQVTAWLSGDGSVVEDQVAALQATYPDLHRALLADRNRAWIPRIEAMLEHPGSTFVLVGDSHMPGDDGLPRLLAQHGLHPQRAL